MANSSPPSIFSILLLFFLLATTAATVNGVNPTSTSQEVETMLESLRNHGHTLFTNAITTSDLLYQLLNTAAKPDSPFTLFAPKDALLYALDMTSDAAAYISTLRYHVVPNHRHSFADLQTISSPFLDTLLPHYSVLIGRTQHGDASHNNASVGVMVDGVRISNPDLFIGSKFAVHGIDGILVTGLNMNQELVSKDNGLGLFSPAESPFPEFDGNIPPETSPTPRPSQSDWKNIPPETSPTPRPSQSDWKNIPHEKSPTPTLSQFDWKNIPPETSPTPTPTLSQFDWKNIPVAPMYSFDGNNPVVAPPQRAQDHPQKMNSFKKKKKRRVKGHEKGHGHRRVSGLQYHRLKDL